MTEQPAAPTTWDDAVAEAFRAIVDRAARGVASQDEGALLRQHTELLLADLARCEEVVGELNQSNTRLARDLARARRELADRNAAESADAAAGSYALRAERAEEQRDQLAALVRDFLDPDPCQLDHHGYCQAHSWMCGGSPCPHARAREVLAALDDEPAIADPARWLHIVFTSPDPTTANTSALNLRDHLAAEFDGVGMRITTNAVELDTPPVCELPHQTVTEEGECEQRRLTAKPGPRHWLLQGARDLSIPAHRFTAHPVTPEMERAATERAVQAAADSERTAAWFAATGGVLGAPGCSPGQEETEPDNPAADATHTTRPARVRIRTWNGHHDPALAAWAGPAAAWDGNQLVIRTGDGETRPEPGWSLVRWPDGEVIVASPWAVSQCYRPAEENRPAQSGADTRDLIDTTLRTTPRADCTDWPAREPHGQGHRYDMRCALCAGEADALTDAVHAALQPRLAALAEYENAVNWHTDCLNCARILDNSIRETERAERAENAVAHARSLHRETCPLARGKIGRAAFTCGMCDALDGLDTTTPGDLAAEQHPGAKEQP